MKRKIEKTDGKGNTILVDDPDWMDLDGNFKKLRRKPTNTTPKKKKRRKRN